LTAEEPSLSTPVGVGGLWEEIAKSLAGSYEYSYKTNKRKNIKDCQQDDSQQQK
jgi:hypothetical protein